VCKNKKLNHLETRFPTKIKAVGTTVHREEGEKKMKAPFYIIPPGGQRNENTSIVSDIRLFERSDFNGTKGAQSTIAIEITENSLDFFQFPLK